MNNQVCFLCLHSALTVDQMFRCVMEMEWAETFLFAASLLAENGGEILSSLARVARSLGHR